MSFFLYDTYKTIKASKIVKEAQTKNTDPLKVLTVAAYITGRATTLIKSPRRSITAITDITIPKGNVKKIKRG